MAEPVHRAVPHDCQDDEKVIAAYADIGAGPALVFDGGGFTDPASLRGYITDLTTGCEWLEETLRHGADGTA